MVDRLAMQFSRVLPGHLPAASAFLLALIVRGISLISLRGTPFTEVMVGDSLLYLETAGTIRGEGIAAVGVFFQSAPGYPFFV